MNKMAFTPLQDERETEALQSGVEPLHNWLRRTAKQHIAKDISRTFVAVDIEHPAKALGYYALTVDEAVSDAWPTAIVEKMRGQGPGVLLYEAIQRIVRVSAEIEVALIVVDAKDTQAAAFYQHFGFIPFPDPLQRLAMSVAAAKANLPSSRDANPRCPHSPALTGATSRQ
jgi:GNAT superfamily N-acetyltransferase